ncbi:hypothetical protein, partial [Pedobacter frigiditerrae]
MTVKQAVGIDVAKKELVVSIGRMSHDTGVDIYAHKTFSNHARGFMDLVAWVDRMTMRGVQTRYV